MHRRTPLLACYLALVILLWAWPPGASAATNPVELALIVAQTGIAATDNLPAIDAANLAVMELNRRGGVLGRKLRVHIIDNQSTPLGSKVAAQIAAQRKVTGVVGPLWSSHAMAMAPVLQAARIPMITPTATQPAITQVGNYIFRACINDAFQGRVMARFAYHDLGARTALVIKNVNEEYSMTLARHFAANFIKNGGQVLWKGQYVGKAIDFTTVLSAARQHSADVCFVPGYARDSGLLLKQARSLALSATFLGGDGWGPQMKKYAGPALEGSYYTTQWHPQVAFERNRHLRQMYREEYGIHEIRDMRTPLTYDAVMLLADAIRRARSTDPEAIRAALAATLDFQGASGAISFDEHGDPVDKAASIITFREGQPHFIKSVRP